MPRSFVLLACLSVLPSLSQAQPVGEPETNAAVLAEMARSCVPEALGPGALALIPPSRLPFLRSALVDELQERGIQVMAAPDSGLAVLELDLERAGVTYGRAGGGRVTRMVSMSLAVQFVNSAGTVSHDELCTPDFEDEVFRSEIPALEDSAYPETRGVAPLSIWRRAIQPAVITLATAAGTVLFFSLRSRRSDGS
ncbi:MAG: hypothetical protein HKN29_04990 [Rhodothermales bacterium]|nr:hypothetical protein [Rhodothermales bacterium]